jgi:DNA-binding transcriptional regulator YdaS (Cro superfamily)
MNARPWAFLSPFERLCRIAGNKSRLARALGISRQAVFLWGGVVPRRHLAACVALTEGLVTAPELRPDLAAAPAPRPAAGRRRRARAARA